MNSHPRILSLEGKQYVSRDEAKELGYDVSDLCSIYVDLYPIINGAIFRAPELADDDRNGQTYTVDDFYIPLSSWRMHLLSLEANKPKAKKERKRSYRTYVIEAAETGTVKIGRAANCKARLLQLQTGSFAPLVLLADFADDIEAKLHQLFKASHLRGEWFTYSDEIRQWLAANAT